MTDAQNNNDEPEKAFFSREVLESVPWALASKLVVFFVSFVALAIIARGLDDEGKVGIYSLCRATADYILLLCALGLNTAIARFVPELRVKENRSGLINLLTKTTIAQLSMFVIIGMAVYFSKPYFDQWVFKIDSKYLLLFTMLLVLGRLGRTLVEDTLTALFHMRTVAILAVLYSVLWVVITALLLQFAPEVSWVLIAQFAALFSVATFGGLYMLRLIARLDWKNNGPGIGRRRILSISIPRQMNQAATLITQYYSEIYFIAVMHSKELAAYYYMGTYLPFTALTFFPMALHKLFTSGFAEAYTRDKNCLGTLIKSYYKVLIIMVLPVSAFGALFATEFMTVLGGEKFARSGPIACAFFVVNLLPLIAMPLALAIVAKEKVLHMQPLTFLKIAVNLTLDYYLIRDYGMWGACAAVALTFVITSPIRLYVASRLIGGIHFPGLFFLRFTVVLFVLAYLVSLTPIQSPFLRIFGLGPAYVVIYACLIRLFRLIKPQDIEEIRTFRFTKVNRLLELLTGTRIND